MIGSFPALLLLVAPFSPQSQEEDRAALTEATRKLEALVDAAADEDVAWREAYVERVRLLESLVATADAAARLSSVAQLRERRAELERELETLRGTQPPSELRLEAAEELEEYEQAEGATGAGLVTARSRLQELATRIEEAETELAALPDRGEAARVRSESLAGEGDTSSYRVESAHVETRLVAERASYLTTALAVWNEEEPLLSLELERATLEDERARAVADLARAEAARLREAEARATRDAAEVEARRAERERDPLERFRLRTSSEAGNLRAESTAFEAVLSDLGARLELERESAEAARAESDALDQRLQLRSRDVDKLLRRHLDRIRRAQRLLTRVTLPELEAALDTNQERRGEVLDRQWALGLPDEENEVLAELVAEVPSSRANEAVAAFHAALKDAELVDALAERADQLERAANLHGDLLAVVQERRQSAEAFEEFVLARMLWTRSDPPLDAGLVGDLVKDLARVPGPATDATFLAPFRETFFQRLPAALGLLGAFVALLLLGRGFARWPEVGRGRKGWTGHTLRVLAGLAWATTPAAQLWLLALAARAVGSADVAHSPLAIMLEYQAGFLLARRLVVLLFGDGGLLIETETFGTEVGKQIVRSARILTLSGQILYAPYRLLAGPPFQLDVLPRLLYMAWMLCANLAALSLVRRNGALVQRWTIEGGLLRTILRFLVVVWILLLPAHLALDAMGYRVGVERSMINALKVFGALFVLGALFRAMERVGNAIVSRSTARAERSEAVERATRSLVRVSATLLVILAGFSLRYWWQIGGVLSKLFVNVELVELGTGQHLTLWDVWLAVVWITIGHLLSTNLRRVHEILVAPFEGTSDEGSRYAFLAIVRYVVISAAYARALLQLGFSFETLGWFATAASVGLGFGLQEIVANFISGLILLFERPVRVGDIVTIGSTSGTVDDISMRATVITNWERQTIIVPNKRFITENLTNWTRNDKVMRREIDVRVAYGSDVQHVIEAAEEVLREHEAVLDDPAPRVWFHAFGVVGLEFKVLFFTAIDQGLKTRSEVHVAIHERFKEEGIEMPRVKPEDLARIQAGVSPP